MREDKDMIEINLNATPSPTPPSGKMATNYFGNIRFAKAAPRGFPYGEASSELSASSAKYSSLEGRIPAPGTAAAESAVNCCARHMYCPDCQQRLEARRAGADRLYSWCCLPLFPLTRLKRHISRSMVCGKCGNNLGYLKQT